MVESMKGHWVKEEMTTRIRRSLKVCELCPSVCFVVVSIPIFVIVVVSCKNDKIVWRCVQKVSLIIISKVIRSWRRCASCEGVSPKINLIEAA